ncbi:MAG: homocysteine S-methyltransferase family protein [Clostridiales bacterium]|nr:homocysteine S-methyltransferase family protein [Clostridiales bacterium]
MNNNDFRNLIDERGRLLFDGAMGTALITAHALVLEAGERSEHANLKAPETVARIHEQNIQAGCDIITTNTFGANGWGRDSTQTEAALRAGVQIARRAVSGRKVFVALDIGPVGALIGFTPGLDAARAESIFAEMVRSGVSEGADLILIETISDLAELTAALTAAKENSDLPVLCSMSFNADGRTYMGVSAAEFANAARAGGAAAIGVNCMLGPAEMTDVTDLLLASAEGLPVLVQPNAGQPKLTNGEPFYDMTPEAFANDMRVLLAKGVRIAGGCCGTTPAMITLLRKLMDEGPQKITDRARPQADGRKI